MMVNKEKTK